MVRSTNSIKLGSVIINNTSVSVLIRLIVLSVVLLVFEYDKSIKCIELLWYYLFGYIGLLLGEYSFESQPLGSFGQMVISNPNMNLKLLKNVTEPNLKHQIFLCF